MEHIATEYLKRTGAYLEPQFKAVPSTSEDPVQASVVIPVRNREKTVPTRFAVFLIRGRIFVSTSSSWTPFDGSDDREILRGVADSRLVHIIPDRTDLGIGGCWNAAIYSAECGRYAVQLDSDDLYINNSVLQRIIAELERGPYAMVIGSYTMVDFSLREIPPGLIAHREWTRENGRNNALRINGLGAPRAFDTSVLRQIGFPNVSYGEDYAVGLASAAIMRLDEYTTPFISAADGKATAIALFLLKSQIAMTRTRTGSEVWNCAHAGERRLVLYFELRATSRKVVPPETGGDYLMLR